MTSREAVPPYIATEVLKKKQKLNSIKARAKVWERPVSVETTIVFVFYTWMENVI